LKESAERLGRKDWLNVLLGGLFGLAVTLVLDPEKAKGLLSLAGPCSNRCGDGARADSMTPPAGEE